MYNPLVIANHFISKSLQEGTELTPMKLLKLVYISHGWYLGNFNKPLINEAVLHWRYGPVIRSVYNAVKHYGRGQIESLIDINNDNQISPETELPNSPETELFLDKVWESYKSFNGMQLSQMTHELGSPWDIIDKSSSEAVVIPEKTIHDYYKARVDLIKARQ